MGKIAEFVEQQFKAYGEGSIDLPQMLKNFAEYGRKLSYRHLLDMLLEEIDKQADK